MSVSSFNVKLLENKIRDSNWWSLASAMPDSHYNETSGIMLTHHLEAVYNNIEDIFSRPETGFYKDLFTLLKKVRMNKEQVKNELKIVSLLHDIGKTKEDKQQVIPHPLTGKPAHMRHGIVGLMATMEIIGNDLIPFPQQQKNIYRTVELHDISYGLFREFSVTGNIPHKDKLHYIGNKIHEIPSIGLLYLLVFKLADTHGHDNISDIIWFYNVAQEKHFSHLNINLPVPEEKDIR
ncbi:MAG: hypothetical protein KBF74_07095 [Ferruginibacter sp.]|nr:hypothetical protein [Ferruginibacter sp.]